MNYSHCPVCDHPYFPEDEKYCTQCGKFLKQKIKPSDEIKSMEKEPRPYSALRFTSALIIGIGWTVIIISWIAVLLWYTLVNTTFQKVSSGLVFDPFLVSLTMDVTIYISFGCGVIGTVMGILMIATGEIYSVFLDIRDDTHVTMRLIRRFGLMLSE